MTPHRLYYYPYASFTNQQLPLLKVAAVWFDELVILDPIGASLHSIGVDPGVSQAVQLLRQEGILRIVDPATVLQTFEGPMAAAIRADLADPAFLQLCQDHAEVTGHQRWTLSLAKVPQDLQADQALRHLLGDFARSVAGESSRYVEMAGVNPADVLAFAETGQAYDEIRPGPDGPVEYRYADLPLALGEAVMVNHALFAGLLQAAATPISDDPFHSQALALKLARAQQDPAVQQAQAIHIRQQKLDQLAATALLDAQLNLPVLDPSLSLEEILDYRRHHNDDLQQARQQLAGMARRIRQQPWTADFAAELEHQTIPDLMDELNESARIRDSWLKSNRGRLALSAAGIGVGAASAVLAVFSAPLTPIALATAGLGLVSGTVIPGAEWLLEWRDGRSGAEANGLHYLLRV
jgi:hypothetical protein